MVALLIKGGADPLKDAKPNDVTKIKNGLEYAESFAKDKKCKYQEECKIMVELMKDSKKLENRLPSIDVRIAAQDARETKLMITYGFVMVILGVGVAGYLHFAKGMDFGLSAYLK